MVEESADAMREEKTLRMSIMVMVKIKNQTERSNDDERRRRREDESSFPPNLRIFERSVRPSTSADGALPAIFLLPATSASRHFSYCSILTPDRQKILLLSFVATNHGRRRRPYDTTARYHPLVTLTPTSPAAPNFTQR